MNRDKTRAAAARKKDVKTSRRFWGPSRFVLIQLTVVAAILLCLEVVLGFLGVEKRDNAHEKPPSTYPATPDDYVKVAIFGGSAAAGTYSPRGLHDILEYELKARFPNKKFYVKNYASHGEPFHRHQAEYAKRLVDRYDFVLIYCGNNEAENWYDDSGYWRTPEYKDAKDLVFSPPADAAKLPFLHKQRAMLAEHSRIFSMASRVRDRFRAPVTKNRNHDYSEFESEPSIPKDERAAIVTNFETDIREICDLAREHGTRVLLSTAATFETWPPSYSTFDSGISDVEKQKWHAHYADGFKSFQANEYREAIAAFELALEIDSAVAILNYRIGISYLRLGDSVQARGYLADAIDGEGHYFRSHTPLRFAAQYLASEIEHLHHVDIVAALHKVLEGEVTDDDLFTDVCHPSFLGYVIMSHTFLDRLATLEPLADETSARTTSAGSDWNELAEQLYRDLNVLPDEDKVAIAGNVLYCFDLMHFCAYPDRCIEQIEKLMARMAHLGPEDPMVETFNSVCRARLAIRESDFKAATDEINIALVASPDDLDMILDLKAWNHYIEDEFTAAGIEYSKELGEFGMP